VSSCAGWGLLQLRESRGPGAILLLAGGNEEAPSLCPGPEDKGQPASETGMHGGAVTGQEGSESCRIYT